jgi:hypothetical protein
MVRARTSSEKVGTPPTTNRLASDSKHLANRLPFCPRFKLQIKRTL